MRLPLEPGRWARVEALFAEALERPEAERASYLEEACGDDRALLEEVKSLLARAQDDPAERFGAVERVARELLATTGAAGEGRRLGPYRLEEEIGRGGMGVVFRGVREEGGFQQTVAVKVLPGALFQPEAIRRFENERRILASLEHTNIARLLDGGSTPDGVPYVIMEYVDGRAIDRYVEESGLDFADRVWLFLAVCDAVRHAHRSLVVHRDLKPSNILVTSDGVPKLLDFGIAKLIAPDANDDGHTRTGIMTPRYASPEQLRGEPVGTSTDVYSLGMVFYRLLAGVHPLQDSGDSRPDAGDLVQRLLRERPSAPSARSGDRRLRGDLDTIVLKAIREDPEERYSSVEALADDLRLYLADRPISARPPTLRYRARKLFARRRAAVLGTLAAASIVLVLSGLFLARLSQERAQAQASAERAERTLDFLTEVFRTTDPWVSSRTDLTALEVVGQGSSRIVEELNAEPEVRAELLSTLGHVYENLGAFDSAQAVFRRALEARESAFGPDAVETAEGLVDLAGTLIEADQFAEAQTLLSRSLDIRRSRLPAGHPDLAETLAQWGVLAQSAGDLQGADTLFLMAQALLEEPVEPRPALLGSLLSNRGILLVNLDRIDEALVVLDRAVTVRREVWGDRHPEVAVTLNHTARAYEAREQYEEAEATYREILAWGPETLGAEHPMVTTWRNNLAVVLRATGRAAEAIDLQLQVVDAWRDAYGTMHGDVAVGLNNLGNLYGEAGLLDEGQAALEEALAISQALLGNDNAMVATHSRNLARLAWRRGEYLVAASMQERVLEMDRRHRGPEHEVVAGDLTGLGEYFLFADRIDDAGPPLREGWGLMRSLRGDADPATVPASLAYADWLVATGDGERAAEVARDALSLQREVRVGGDYLVGHALSTLGAALAQLGSFDEAESSLLRARDALAEAAPANDPRRVRNEHRLEELSEAIGKPLPGVGPTP